MNKINILLSNNAFAEDLAQQIERALSDVEISFEEPDKKTCLIIADDESEQHQPHLKEIPVILLSDNSENKTHADILIKKPFKLYDFLEGLKNKTLLPKVRRKECLIIKEYSLYPVNKEIKSSFTGNVVKLTEKEVAVLKYLYQISPASAGKEELLENVWEYNSDVTTHTIETHIYRLRQKVEQNSGSQLIITENNGYRLNI